MSKTILLLLLAASATASSMPAAPPGLAPLELVNLRMQQYNERHIDAMLALYADDIEVYAYPDRLLGKGKPHLRRVLEDTLKDSSPVRISHQVARGRFVVSDEEVTYKGSDRRFTSIYEVSDGLIRSVRFIRD
jgi:hypothetical protein